MRTAIALKKTCHDVVIVEKLAYPGGTINLAASYMTQVGTKEQRKPGKVLSLDDYMARQLKDNPDMNEIRIREVRGASQETLDRLNALGANITRAMSGYQLGTADGSSLGSAIAKVMSVNCRSSALSLAMKLPRSSCLATRIASPALQSRTKRVNS